ncbi:Peroxin/Dysferlin domain-containing protein [Absidia repens]|uniref:Peroxin/Dysferlin domain-containing protein n=1 Tax=Absidia repens TaxID=90262 RepID=A0A1X2I4F1_9FUNG|nr:Peroxin/Dysferlin domain-containing protein [Absidia repens]
MSLNRQNKTMASMTNKQSFSSPYSLDTLDNIPPIILKLFVSLGPLLQAIRQALDIIQWRSTSPRQSILTLLLWNCFCFWTWPVLALGIPMIILYKLASDWLRIRTTRTRRDRLERALLQQLEKQKQQHQDQDHEDDERLLSQRLQQQREAEEEELISRKIQPHDQVSLDDTLQNVIAINAFVDRFTSGCRFILDNYLDGSRCEILIATLGVLVYAIPAWLLVVFALGSNGTFALLGSIALLWYSPWTHVIMMAVRRYALLRYAVSIAWAYSVALVTSWKAFNFLGSLATTQSSSSSTATSNDKPWRKWLSYVWNRAGSEKRAMISSLKGQDNGADDTGSQQKQTTKCEMVFQFEVYENQRWWLGANWTSNMLSTERGPWTDNQLTAISSKEEFKLPQPVEKTAITGQRNDVKQVTIKTWNWADSDWWVDMTGELDGRVDHGGWEYGNNAWHHLTGMPAMQTFTRRRRWCRRARLVERLQQQSVGVETESSTSQNQANDTGLRHRS